MGVLFLNNEPPYQVLCCLNGPHLRLTENRAGRFRKIAFAASAIYVFIITDHISLSKLPNGADNRRMHHGDEAVYSSSCSIFHDPGIE